MFRVVVQEEYDDPFDFYLAPTVEVTLPTGVQGYSYVVSNLTVGIEMPAASVLPGGVTYALSVELRGVRAHHHGDGLPACLHGDGERGDS